MNFEEFLTEAAAKSQAHHTEMAAAFHNEAQKHPAGSKPHHENMALHHWHASEAASRAGNKEVARHHAHASYGYSN